MAITFLFTCCVNSLVLSKQQSAKLRLPLQLTFLILCKFWPAEIWIHVHVCFELWGKSFLSLTPYFSHGHKVGSLAAVVFHRCFLAKAERGWFCFDFLLERIVQLCIFVIMQQTLHLNFRCAISHPMTSSHCGMGADPSDGRVSHPPGRTVSWLFWTPDSCRTLWYTNSVAPWTTCNLRPG